MKNPETLWDIIHYNNVFMIIYSYNGVDKLNGHFFHSTQSGANLSKIVEVKSGPHVANQPPTNLLD